MNFCKRFTEFNKMFGRLNGVLQTAADVLAPPPTALQDFQYHWKQVKKFYTIDQQLPKIHINDTNIPMHLEQMLQILIQEETEYNAMDVEIKKECLEFVLNSRPLDLFSELAVTDTPPGATILILNWIRRFLSCLTHPKLEQESIFQPIQKLISLCNGTKASPYENEEVLFLLTVAGIVRKEPCLINLFLPSHQHSAYVNLNTKNLSYNNNNLNFKQNSGNIKNDVCLKKIPIKNTLFDCTESIDASMYRISFIQPEDYDDGNNDDNAPTTTNTDNNYTTNTCNNKDNDCDLHTTTKQINNCSNDNNCVNSQNNDIEPKQSTSRDIIEKTTMKGIVCDCDEEDRLYLLDAILSYFESPDNIVIVRASESALILASLPSVDINCRAVKSSLNTFCIKISEKLAHLCQQIPDDMDTGDIEDCTVSWGLIPRDVNVQHFIGRAQLNEFLCWLDYSNCLVNECYEMSYVLCEQIRINLLESVIEPGMIDTTAQFMLILVSKIIRQLDSKVFSDELANWLVGKPDDINPTNDCLLTIIIENAQDNSDILLPTLQFVESLLDNCNERILNGMIFRYINHRGYYDSSIQMIQTWSDEEDERVRRRGSVDGHMKSRTLAPVNILKVINNFLLLLPRQIMCETVGTCYEEYVQDASRHYQNWIKKTSEFNWPMEAIFPDKNDLSPEVSPAATSLNLSIPSTNPSKKQDDHDQHQDQSILANRLKRNKNDPQYSDSGISEESFYEGPLLRMLFLHIRNMSTHPYELNLAVVAILSKLAFLPHPYLHEILLNPEIPLSPGTHTLWSSMQALARILLLEVPRQEGFQKKVAETGKRLLVNPPIISESEEECDPLFESLVVLEEFCKELAAIAFVKYHHATE